MVRAIMIVEMAGRPAKHLTESLEKHVGILHQVEDLEVHEIRVSEPRIIAREEGKENNNTDDMFTAFAECEFEAPDFARLSETMFDFMPSSVEVIEPSRVELDAAEATGLLNNISGRLHRYDEIAKIAGEKLRQMESQMRLMQSILIQRDKIITELKQGVKIKDKKQKVVSKEKK